MTHEIKVYSYDSLDSTQKEAARLLREITEQSSDYSPGFAVWAQTQTQGQGRTGASWQSPRGNLYLTLVLPSANFSHLDNIPLRVAGVLARWAYETYGVCSVIKWPNDLLIGDKKWGGILCESSRSGSDWGPLLIGFGLNLRFAPLLPDVDYKSTCIGEHVSTPPEVSLLLVRSLCEFFLAHGKREGMSWFHQFKTPDGSLWLHKDDGSFWVQQEISSDGRLVLREPLSAQEVRLASAQHGYRFAGSARAADEACQ